MGQQVTTKEIAAMVGTSQASVSLVINGKWAKRVRPDVAEAVLKIASERSFKPSRVGRSLAMRRNLCIAVCVPATMIDHEVSGAYSFHEMLGIVTRELSKNDYALDIFRLEAENGGQPLEVPGCDGAIAISPLESDIPKLESLGRKQPLVVVDHLVESSACSCVSTNMASAIADVTARLIAHGRRRILLLNCGELAHRFAQKREGFFCAHWMAGRAVDESLVVNLAGGDICQRSYKAAMDFLNPRYGSARPDAVICTDNAGALGVMQAMHRLGVTVGQDVDLVGFGDGFLARLVVPELTYVQRPIEKMTSAGVSMLLQLIDEPGAKPESRRLKETLVIGETGLR